jgi:Domain of unknown function (DUF6532)
MLKKLLKIDPTDKMAISQLLDKNNYVYPCRDAVIILLMSCSHISLTDPFHHRHRQIHIYHRPFQAELIQESVTIGFFGPGNTSSQFAQMFDSSDKEHPDELEVPAYMVAAACTAVRVY